MRHALLGLVPMLLPLAVADLGRTQTTWLVGPDGQPDIATVVGLAQDGDIVHVQPGAYAGFLCSKGISIRALQPGTVTIGQGPTRFLLTPTQRVHLTGLDFDATVQVDFGRVAMDGCSIHAPNYALYVHYAALHMVHCTVRLSGIAVFHTAALRSDNSDITAIDCVFAGGPSPTSPIGDGIACWGSRVHLSNVTAYGDGAAPYLSGIGGGINAMFDSTVWLTDSTASSLFSCPIRSFQSTVHVDGTTTTGTFGVHCGTAQPKSMLAVSQPTPLTAGAPFSLDYRGQPNGILAVFAAPSPATHLLPTLLDQPSWLDPVTSFGAGLALLDASGRATMTWNIPAGPGIADQTLWFKGISGLTLPLQVAPAAGGIAR